MTLIARMRSMITGKTAPEQLAEVQDKIVAIDGDIARIDGDIARLALPQLTGDVEAARVAAQLELDKRELAAALVTLRRAESQLTATVATETAVTRRAEAAVLPRRIAEQRDQVLDLDDQIERAAKDLAAKLAARADAGDVLVRLVGSPQLKRSQDAICRRFVATLAPLFQRSASGIADNPIHGGGGSINLLGLVPTQHGGPAAWQSLRQLDQAQLDDEAPYFEMRGAADQAAKRRADRGDQARVHEMPGGVFTLIPEGDVYVDRGTAEAAADMAGRSGSLRPAVIPIGNAFVVRPPRAADAGLILP